MAHARLRIDTGIAVVPPHPPDVLAEPLITLGSPRPALGIAVPDLELIVQRRGDRQDRADRLDPELLPMLSMNRTIT
jgi:hypothetical protein